MKSSLTLAALTLAVAAAPLAAQQHQHGQAATDSTQRVMMHCSGMEMMRGMMMGGMHGGDMQTQGGAMGEGRWMMQAMRLSPRYLLAHTEELSLDKTQVAKLEALGSRRGMDRDQMRDMRSLHQRLERAFQTTPADTAGIRTAFEEIATVTARMHAHHFATAASARAILTPAQRGTLDALPAPCPMQGGNPETPGRGGHEHDHGRP